MAGGHYMQPHGRKVFHRDGHGAYGNDSRHLDLGSKVMTATKQQSTTRLTKGSISEKNGTISSMQLEDSTLQDYDSTLIANIKRSWKMVLRTAIQHRGVLWAIFAVFAATACSLCVKLLAGRISASEILFYRGIFQMLFTAPKIVYHRISVRYSPKALLLIATRGFIGTVLSFMSYYAFQTIPVATAKALINSSPLYVCLFARILLKEHYSAKTAAFSVLIVVSVALVVQPPFIFGGTEPVNWHVLGLIAAILAAIVLAICTIFLRYIQLLRIDVQVIIFVYGFIAALCSTVATTLLVGKWTVPGCGRNRLFIIGMCVAGFLEQVSTTLSLKTENASVIGVIRCNDVLVAFLVDYIFFDIVANVWSFIGCFGVVACAIGMTLTAYYANKRGRDDVATDTDADLKGDMNNNDVVKPMLPNDDED